MLQCNSTSIFPRYTTCPAKMWDLNQQKSEMAKAGLDSSLLAPFLPEPESDHPHEFPPLDSTVLDPHSQEFYQVQNQVLSKIFTMTLTQVSRPLCTVFLTVRVQQSFVQSKVSCKSCSRSVLFSQVIPPGCTMYSSPQTFGKGHSTAPKVCCGLSRPKCYHVRRWVSNSIGFKHFGCPQWWQTFRKI